MRYAYKVWHSEEHKNLAKQRAGRVLDSVEIAYVHQNLHAPLELNAELDPLFEPNVVPLQPSSKGAIVVLDGYAGADAADAWMTAFLVRLNKLQPDLYLMCVPLPVQLDGQGTRPE